MTKDRKIAPGLEGRAVELDRMLGAFAKKTLGLVQHLQQNPSSDDGKRMLDNHLARHPLLRKKRTSPPVTGKATDQKKRIYRFERYLSVLPDEDLENIMALIKSMSRNRMPPRTKSPTRRQKGKDDEGSASMPPETKSN